MESELSCFWNDVFDAEYGIRFSLFQNTGSARWYSFDENYLPVKHFIYPDQFEEYKEIGLKLGFRHVESSALVRSSYKAQKHIN